MYSKIIIRIFFSIMESAYVASVKDLISTTHGHKLTTKSRNTLSNSQIIALCGTRTHDTLTRRLPQSTCFDRYTNCAVNSNIAYIYTIVMLPNHSTYKEHCSKCATAKDKALFISWSLNTTRLCRIQLMLHVLRLLSKI